MPKRPEWRPRLSIELDEARYNRMRGLFPWGAKAPFFKHVIDIVCDAIEKHGAVVLAAIFNGNVELSFKETKPNAGRPEEKYLRDDGRGAA